MKHPVTMALELVSIAAGALSERAIAIASGVLGRLWWSVLRYRRGVILENLAIAFPGLAPGERLRRGQWVCVHLVRTMLEFFRIPRYVAQGFDGVVRFEGLEHFEAAKRAGKGVLCLSGHLGSFELAVAAVASRAHPVALVVKSFPRPVDAFLTRVRSSAGLGLIRARQAGRGILDALGRNESVVFVLDQNATRSVGVFVDFFGRTASTFSALASIALRTGAPVIAAIPYRNADGTHVLQVLPAIPLEHRATKAETVRHMTGVYTRVLEEAIRAHPEQWLWTHKRWRTQPRGPAAPEGALPTVPGGDSFSGR